jgi:hypothetical protein
VFFISSTHWNRPVLDFSQCLKVLDIFYDREYLEDTEVVNEKENHDE